MSTDQTSPVSRVGEDAGSFRGTLARVRRVLRRVARVGLPAKSVAVVQLVMGLPVEPLSGFVDASPPASAAVDDVEAGVESAASALADAGELRAAPFYALVRDRLV